MVPQSAQEALQQEAMAMGQSMYSQPGADGGAAGAGPGAEGATPGGGASAGPSDPNVVDAEFTDADSKDSSS